MMKTLLPFKAYYFFNFAAMAFLGPFLTLYYRQLGLNGQQIGILAALPSLVTFFSAPVFGALADLTQRHRQILGGSLLLVSAMVIVLSTLKTFLGLIPGIVLYTFFLAPALPIIDRSVLEVLGARRDQYGKTRLWGALGWGLSAPIAGYVVGYGGLQWSFYGAALLILVLFLVSQLTPVQQVKRQGSYWKGLRGLLAGRQVVLFFLVILMGGMGIAMVHHYLYLYLNTLGASTVTMGFSMTVATVSELLVMYYADRLLKTWKASGMLLVGLVMLVVRFAGYAFAPNPGIVLVFQMLHGPTFAALWLAGVAYVAEIAPPGLGITAQGLFTGVFMGLGSALGALVGGFLFELVGFSQLFLVTAGGILLAAVGFAFSLLKQRSEAIP